MQRERQVYPVKATCGGMTVIETAKCLEPRPTSLLSVPRERVPYDFNELEKAC